MDTDDAGEEGGTQSNEQGETDDALTGTILECALATQDVYESWSDGVYKEEHVSKAREKDPQC